MELKLVEYLKGGINTSPLSQKVSKGKEPLRLSGLANTGNLLLFGSVQPPHS
jgi:hypothetical protein